MKGQVTCLGKSSPEADIQTSSSKAQHNTTTMATPSRPAPDRRTSTIQKRASLLPKPSSIVLDPSVLIAQHAQLTGTHPITVGPSTVLHPHCKISSTLAPVVLGEGVIVYERAKVGVGMGDGVDMDSRRSSVASRASVRDSMRGEGTVLGRHVVIETHAVIEAAEVGEGTVVEAGAYLGRGCVVGKVGRTLLRRDCNNC